MTEQAVPQRHRLRWIAIIIAVLALLVVVVGALVFIVAQDEQKSGLSALGATSVDADSLPRTVQFRQVAGHIVVDAFLAEGGEAVPIILDSGAPMTLSDELAERYGGEPVGRISIAAIDRSVLQKEVVRVPAVAIGGAAFDDVGAIKGFVDRDNPLSCISPNGLIGASLMQTGVWQLDYGKGELTIASSVDGLDHIDGAASIGFRGATSISPSPIIEVSAGEGTLTFLVDTGSDGSLTLNPADLEAVGASVGSDAPMVDSIAAGFAGTYVAQIVYAAADLGIGDLSIDGIPLATLDSLEEGQGNMGNSFLSQFVVTIDWPESMLYLEPIGEEVSAPPPASADITWDGERIVLGSLVAGSDADVADVTLEAPVAAIDGVDVSAATRDDFCALLVELADQPFEMTLGGDQGGTVPVAPVTDFYDSLGD